MIVKSYQSPTGMSSCMPLLCIHESIHRRFIAPISTMTSPHLSIEAMMVCVDPQLEFIAQ